LTACVVFSLECFLSKFAVPAELFGQNSGTPKLDSSFRVWDFAFADNYTVKVYSGFLSKEDAQNEFLACGGQKLFSNLRFGVAVHDPDVLRAAGDAVRASRLFHGDLVERVTADLVRKAEDAARPLQRHSELRIPLLNLFLLPFVVVNSGMTIGQIARLPFYASDKSELGKILNNVLGVILPVWEQRWCPPRGLQWLREHCTNESGRIVLFIDGVDFEFEKFLSFYLQRVLWGTKSKHLAHPAVRCLVFTNEKMDLVHVSKPAGGIGSEVNLLLLDRFFSRINDEAKSEGKYLDLDVIVDRGYFDWNPIGRFSNLVINKQSPVHLVAPESKDVKKARRALKEKRKKRTFFTGREALDSKVIQRQRQVNERGNRMLRKGRFYSRRIALKWLSKIGRFIKLSQGFANRQNALRLEKKIKKP
jgi:hypothetical protein